MSRPRTRPFVFHLVHPPASPGGNPMRDAVIVDAVRTPIGRRGGALVDIHPANLTAHVLTSLAERTGLDPETVDDVVWGCVSQVGEQAGSIARTGVLAAGWPVSIPGVTMTRACGSSQQAVSFAAAAVIAGDRKSTRLNSSHQKISYAVFCLKKKKYGNTQKTELRLNSHPRMEY